MFVFLKSSNLLTEQYGKLNYATVTPIEIRADQNNYVLDDTGRCRYFNRLGFVIAEFQIKVIEPSTTSVFIASLPVTADKAYILPPAFHSYYKPDAVPVQAVVAGNGDTYAIGGEAGQTYHGSFSYIAQGII